MNRFSDFGIDPLKDKKIFAVPQISIEEAISKEVEVIDFIPGVKTAHGDDRYIVKIKIDGGERKFFTSAAPIKEALNQIPPEQFPFLATINQQRIGKNKTYFFI